MAILWWVAIRYVPGGESFGPPALNSFVHALMYLYYTLSAAGPAFKKYLTFKKHITKIQMLQFCLIFIKMCTATLADCKFPKVLLMSVAAYCVIMMVLFANFFRHAYHNKKDK